MENCRAVDEFAEIIHCICDRRAEQLCYTEPGKYCHDRSDKYIDLCFLADKFADLAGYKNGGKGTRRAGGIFIRAEHIAHGAHDRRGEQNKPVCLQRSRNGNSDSRSHDIAVLRIGCYRREERSACPFTECRKYSADQQRGKQALRHGTHCRYKIILPGNAYILFFEKSLEIQYYSLPLTLFYISAGEMSIRKFSSYAFSSFPGRFFQGGSPAPAKYLFP